MSRIGRLSSKEYRNDQAKEQQKITLEQDKNLRRVIGIIHEVDPRGKGLLEITARVPSPDGSTHMFGDGKIPISIADSPMDILLRFGGVRPGMLVEIFYRGVSEQGRAAAHIIGYDSQEARAVNLIPDNTVKTASSLPFEPMGFL